MAADWTNLPKEHPLRKFQEALPEILGRAGYSEMYGIELRGRDGDQAAPHTTLVVLQKFLRANAGDVEKAEAQLVAALRWRKEYQPLKVRDEVFDADRFGKLGYVCRVRGAADSATGEDVVCFNIYGAAGGDFKERFGDTDAFVRWRVALMELTLRELQLERADRSVPDYGQGPDPYKSIAVHDYMSVSFFRQPPEVKASSRRIIDMFQKYYPETVSRKYFVNVPLVMQWMMGAMKALLSKDSVQSMTWMTDGAALRKYLGPDVPQAYGGSGPELARTAITPKYRPSETSDIHPAPAAAAAAAAPAEEAPVASEPAAAASSEAAQAESNPAPADAAAAVTPAEPGVPTGAPEKAAAVTDTPPEQTPAAADPAREAAGPPEEKAPAA